MSAKQNVIVEALRLNEAERLEVAEALYESLEGPADSDAPQAWDAELARRLADINAGRAKFIPWPEARQQILSDDGPSEETDGGTDR